MACVSYCWTECWGGCQGSCSGSCGACGGNCGGNCTGCSGGCAGGCASGCTGCSGCSGCTNSCYTSCNTGCNGAEMESTYQRLKKLGLKDYIEADNVQDIIDLAYYETLRRNKNNGIIDKLTQYELFVIADYFNHIQDNLKSINFPSKYANNKYNDIVLREMALDLIDKVCTAYETLVPVP